MTDIPEHGSSSITRDELRKVVREAIQMQSDSDGLSQKQEEIAEKVIVELLEKAGRGSNILPVDIDAELMKNPEFIRFLAETQLLEKIHLEKNKTIEITDIIVKGGISAAAITAAGLNASVLGPIAFIDSSSCKHRRGRMHFTAGRIS